MHSLSQKMFGEVQLPLQVLHTALTYPATLKEKHKEIFKQPQNKKKSERYITSSYKTYGCKQIVRKSCNVAQSRNAEQKVTKIKKIKKAPQKVTTCLHFNPLCIYGKKLEGGHIFFFLYKLSHFLAGNKF